MSTSTSYSHSSHHLRAELPAHPIRTILLACVSLGIGMGLATLLEQSRQQSYTGFLQAHNRQVSTDREAVIEKLLVAEGEAVETGQPLIRLADEELEATWIEKKREIAQLKFELEQARAKAEMELAWRKKKLEEEIFETELKSAAYLKEKYAREIESLAWKDFLQEDNAVSSTAAFDDTIRFLVYDSGLPDENRIRAMLKQESAQNASEVHAAQVELCEKRLDELKKIKTELPEKIRRANGVAVAENRLKQATEEVQQLEREKQKLTLQAPGYGTVGVFEKEQGDRVSVGEPIVEILDRNRPFLIVNIPSSEIAEIQAGNEVKLLFGEHERQGVVREIPPQTQELSSSLSSNLEQKALVTLHIDPVGKLWPEVPIGSAVEVVFEESNEESSTEE